MKSPIDIMQESFSLSMRKPSLLYGLMYFGLSIVISLGAAVLGFIIGIIGVFMLAAINIAYVTLAAIALGVLILIIALIILQALFDIFFYRGIDQIRKTGNYDIGEVRKQIKSRILPTTFLIILVILIVILSMAIVIIPPFLLFNELGLLAGILIYLIVVLFAAPLLMMATPSVILENVGAIQALGRGIRLGTRNYLFNLGGIALLMVLTFIVVILSLIPLINILVSFFMTIVFTHYLLGMYEENRQRARL